MKLSSSVSSAAVNWPARFLAARWFIRLRSFSSKSSRKMARAASAESAAYFRSTTRRKMAISLGGLVIAVDINWAPLVSVSPESGGWHVWRVGYGSIFQGDCTPRRRGLASLKPGGEWWAGWAGGGWRDSGGVSMN